MQDLFIELTSEELDDSIRMAHEPTGKDMKTCGNCQGACFCRRTGGEEIEIEELI